MAATDKRYVLDVYRSITAPRRYGFDHFPKAVTFGNQVWKFGGSIYKIKLWDQKLGSIEPNNPSARALVREWI